MPDMKLKNFTFGQKNDHRMLKIFCDNFSQNRNQGNVHVLSKNQLKRLIIFPPFFPKIH